MVVVDHLHQPQTAEQLVEVPAIVSCSLHGNVEQNVDIPVPHRRGGRGGLQDFRPGHVSTAFGKADHVENPAPRVGGLQGFLPRQASTASAAHLPGAADEAFTVVFSHFSFFFFFKKKKSAGVGLHSGSELAADSSKSTRRAYGVHVAVEEDESEPVTESELED